MDYMEIGFFAIFLALGFVTGLYLGVCILGGGKAIRRWIAKHWNNHKEKKRERHENRIKKRQEKKNAKKQKKKSSSSSIKMKSSSRKKRDLKSRVYDKEDTWTDFACAAEGIDEAEFIREKRSRQDDAYNFLLRRKKNK